MIALRKLSENVSIVRKSHIIFMFYPSSCPDFNLG